MSPLRFAVPIALMTISSAALADSVLTQNFTNTSVISIIGPTGSNYPLISQSFYTAVFQPFVGSGLTSALYDWSFSFSGTAATSTSGKGGVAWSITLFLNGIGFIHNGGSTGTGSAGTRTVMTGSDITTDLTQRPSLLALLTSNALLTFTDDGPGVSSSVIALQLAAGDTLQGTLSVTETLTYTYSGNGALATIGVPEPASMAQFASGMMGLGLFRRRRTRKARAG